ncbi:MAG TPA: hypothetical protein VGJ44_02790 [Kribbellaceae bacterium]|jgi:hypothetical protein
MKPHTPALLADQNAAAARVRRNFWLLVAATVIATGVLSRAIAAPAGPLAGITVAVSALAGLLTLALASRILVATTVRRRRHPRFPNTDDDTRST